MPYTRPIATPAGARSTDYARSIYTEVSGSNFTCYTEDDLFLPSIPAALGANLLSTPVTLSPRFMGIHLQPRHTGLTTVLARTHNVAPRWSQQHIAAGTFIDAGMGAWIADMKARGAEVIWNLFHTPTWASARPTETGDQFGVLGALAEPANMANLSAYVTWFLNTYGASIDYLEFWNEPKYNNTSSSYFSGTASKLAEMAKVVYQAAKAIKPSMPIMGVSATGLAAFDGTADTGITHTNSFLDASDGATGKGKDWIDILSVHTYMHDGTNNLRWVPGMKAHLDTIKASNGISSMPVWCTEFGFIDPYFREYDGPPAGHMTLVARYVLAHVAAGMDRCVWYTKHSADYNWPSDIAADPLWNDWCRIINGATVSCINRISARGQLACVINGQRYIV